MTQVRSSRKDAQPHAPNKTPLKGIQRTPALPWCRSQQLSAPRASPEVAEQPEAEIKEMLCTSLSWENYSCAESLIYGLIIMSSASLRLNALVSRGAQHMLLPVQPRRKPRFTTPGTYKPLLQQGITRQP